VVFIVEGDVETSRRRWLGSEKRWLADALGVLIGWCGKHENDERTKCCGIYGGGDVETIRRWLVEKWTAPNGWRVRALIGWYGKREDKFSFSTVICLYACHINQSAHYPHQSWFQTSARRKRFESIKQSFSRLPQKKFTTLFVVCYYDVQPPMARGSFLFLVRRLKI